MDDANIETMYQALRDYTINITVIGLTENKIEDTGAHYIADLLRINKVIYSFLLTNSLFIIQKMTELILESNQIGNEGAKYLAEALKDNNVYFILHFCLFSMKFYFRH